MISFTNYTLLVTPSQQEVLVPFYNGLPKEVASQVPILHSLVSLDAMAIILSCVEQFSPHHQQRGKF